MVDIEPSLDVLDLSDSETSFDEKTKQSRKNPYKDRKFEHKLKKYEAIIKKLENINRVHEESQFLFVGNCGLDNNISQDYLEETFGKYGKVVDIVMPKKRSYSFVIFEQKESVTKAIHDLQSQIITTNQTPIYFYLFSVDKVPETCNGISDFEEISGLPPGLIYLDNYIDKNYSKEIIEFLMIENQKDNSIVDLKRRKVKHFGYEFRYGSNDCDETKQLTGPENKMPDCLKNLINKMLNDKLISVAPDQMTVNYYEPGHGIGPHIDNVTAFDDYIVSLSLLSNVIMEFRQKESKKYSKLLLKANSLLLLKGDSRYKWSHSISERKHDLLIDESGRVLVQKREKRISLTFRKVKKLNEQNRDENLKNELKTEPELKLPSNDLEAKNFEKSFVHTIYNQIADHFSSTRHSAWPGVARFINSMDSYSFMLDVGCGNGKYLNLRNDLYCFGCDYSDQLIKICQERNFNCFVSDCLSVPCKSDFFDYVICIAVIHHLSTEERRIAAVNEIKRILKPGGKALITVWAKEQKYKEKESYYISVKGSKKQAESKLDKKDKTDLDESLTEKDANTNIHKFGKEFQKKDLFVAWHYNKNTAGKKKVKNEDKDTESIRSKESICESNENSSENPESKVYLRFYHVFENNELENLFESITDTRIVESFYEQGNWCVVFEKLK